MTTRPTVTVEVDEVEHERSAGGFYAICDCSPDHFNPYQPTYAAAERLAREHEAATGHRVALLSPAL